ncbi:hypothetical protein KI387_040223, partial [Taxus chinensis]
RSSRGIATIGTERPSGPNTVIQAPLQSLVTGCDIRRATTSSSSSAITSTWY